MGRKNIYNKNIDIIVRNYLMLKSEASTEEIAAFLGVSTKTFYDWQKAHPTLKQAVVEGKLTSSMNVANALYERAIGTTKEKREYKVDPETGEKRLISVVEEDVVADTKAALQWLAVKNPSVWREKKTIQHTLTSGFKDEEELKIKMAEIPINQIEDFMNELGVLDLEFEEEIEEAEIEEGDETEQSTD